MCPIKSFLRATEQENKVAILSFVSSPCSRHDLFWEWCNAMTRTNGEPLEGKRRKGKRLDSLEYSPSFLSIGYKITFGEHWNVVKPLGNKSQELIMEAFAQSHNHKVLGNNQLSLKKPSKVLRHTSHQESNSPGDTHPWPSSRSSSVQWEALRLPFIASSVSSRSLAAALMSTEITWRDQRRVCVPLSSRGLLRNYGTLCQYIFVLFQALICKMLTVICETQTTHFLVFSQHRVRSWPPKSPVIVELLGGTHHPSQS